jgi:hypothetical protein
MKDRGFAVSNLTHGQRVVRREEKVDLSGKKVIDILSSSAKAKSVHGIMITGHGDAVGFGTRNRQVDVTYDKLEDALGYHLAFLILNVCEGGWSRNDKENKDGKIPRFPNGIPAGGRDLLSKSKAVIFGGKKDILWPIRDTIHPSNIMKPGEQGTKE